MKLSIIVPIYNAQDYLATCLDSLIEQDIYDYEIICVNDGSTDASQTIIQEYMVRFPELIKHVEKKNGGLGDARNRGIQESSGEYIGFVDADDFVNKEMYSKMLEAAENENADLVECNFNWIYTDRVKSDTPTYKSNRDLLIPYLRVMVCNKIFKREIIEKIGLRFPTAVKYEDIPFSYAYVVHIKKYVLISDSLYNYVQRKESLSNYQDVSVIDIFEALNQVLNYYKQNGYFESYCAEIEYLWTRILLGSSYLRMSQVTEKKLRVSMLRHSWNLLNCTFPNWRKNKYLKRITFNNIFFRIQNEFLYFKCSSLFFKIKGRKFK